MQTKIITLVFSLFIASTSFAQTATLKMRFVFDGVPPVAKSMNVGAAFPLIADETLLVDPENKGIQNVVVYVYTGPNSHHLQYSPVDESPFGCT